MSKQTIHVGAMNSYEKAGQASEHLRLSKLDKGEAALLGQLKALLFTQYWTALAQGIPLDIELDTLDFDETGISIFHADGSTSAIAVRNGESGRSHVLVGIGQSSQRACILPRARRALLWSSAGAMDTEIAASCERAGVIAMPWRSLESMCAGRDAVIASLEF